MTGILNPILEVVIEVLIWTWIFIGASFTVFLTGWMISKALDWHIKFFNLFKYLLKYLYYRKRFEKWYLENEKNL